jgi:DNA repair exonuclease SbcCD ATPase subunit
MADRFDEILEEMRRDRAERHAQRDEWGARFDAHLAQTDELLRFVGELNRRSEIVFRDLLRSQREMRREIRESIKESRERTAEIKARVEAASADSKAHTRAIFALIDRIEGGGGLAPAG